jgi:hypothetical protein
VLNRKGDVVASAVTNLDLHDIARAARTYGVRRFYVVTPLEDQRQIVLRIITHWTEGAGGRLNPLRKEALARIRLTQNLAEAAADVEVDAGAAPLTVATSAAPQRKTIGFSQLRHRVHNGSPVLLIFGTAWGLAEEALDDCDALLAPIAGNNGYNHLSVRSAAAIIFDRILSPENHPGQG